jgi:hypothetical protein
MVKLVKIDQNFKQRNILSRVLIFFKHEYLCIWPPEVDKGTDSPGRPDEFKKKTPKM